MLFWRVSRHPDLSGAGGLRASARWHERGTPIVYLAECPPGALLEACVHTSANDIPPHYTLLEVSADDSVSVETIDEATLARDWTNRAGHTREIGSAWLKSGRSALLRVPSVLAPRTFNVLLNPLHPESVQVRIVNSWEYPFDGRIKL